MSSHAYVCPRCGSYRRRPARYHDRNRLLPADYPRCCDRPMRDLVKGYAEAASKLRPAQRVVWLAAGGHILRKPGRKWTAAVKEREVALAREQLRVALELGRSST